MGVVVAMKPGRRSLARLLVVLGIAALVGAVAAAVALPMLSRSLETRAAEAMRKRFDSRLDYTRLRVSLFPRVRITGENVVFRHKGRTDVPPLFRISRFTAESSLAAILRRPPRITRARIEGLEIQIAKGRKPPGGFADSPGTKTKSAPPDFVIEEISSNGTRLAVLPKKAGKDPMEYDIRELTLRDAGPERPMIFHAVLMNARPPGEIRSSGTFGPWNRDEPAGTPVSGGYTFQNAGLSVFKGISGILSSTGSYRGVLEEIEVDGTTDTPDFKLTVSGHPVHLTTEFHARVDGTDGDTYLEPVRARFGDSEVVARGYVAKESGSKRKTISLDAAVDRGRLEDMLLLGVRAAKPPMIGAIRFRSKILIPPGDADVSDRLALDGAFVVDAARASRREAQNKIDKLSNLGRGVTEPEEKRTVASDFKGRFVLKTGVLTFHDLSFHVPGVDVALNGTFSLKDQNMDLYGTARMKARPSEMTTGIKSVLLKALDPFLARKGAGTVLPIRITGRRDAPSFGLDLGRRAKRPELVKK